MPSIKTLTLLLFAGMTAACDSKPGSTSVKDSPAVITSKPAQEPNVPKYTDTLQFIHFEGNFDYWYGVFLDARKDTIQLVTDNQIGDKFKNQLVEVKWSPDSLTEAGDSDIKYAAKRLKDIRVIKGALLAKPVTEATIINDVANLPEVKPNADQTGIAERPAGDKEYYLVETGSHDEDHFSRLYMFRVYVYPKYEIKFYDPGADTEISLEAWRKQKP